MGVLPDWMIERDVKIVPFAPQQHRPGVISYGVTSYGYDVRVDRHFKVFTNVWGSTVDQKHFDPKSFVDVEGDFCIIPPNSFALAETVEYLEIPRDIRASASGKALTRAVSQRLPAWHSLTGRAQRSRSLRSGPVRAKPCGATV